MSWLGETTPDAGEAGLNLYLVRTAIFGVLLIVLVWRRSERKRFNSWLYWATIAASTTAGTTLADFSTRSLGIGYPAGHSSFSPACCFRCSLGTAHLEAWTSQRSHSTRRAFYWVTITFSQTLGTALGDWIANSALGYGGGALFFGPCF